MARTLFLCAIPLLAGCFAWDMDEQTYPWCEPNPVDTSVGPVFWRAGEPVPADLTDTKHFPAFYEFPAERPARRVPVPPPAMVDIQARGQGMTVVETEVEVEEAPPEAPAAPAAPTAPAAPAAAPAGNPDLEKKIESLEQRIEELYQLLLKSYEKK